MDGQQRPFEQPSGCQKLTVEDGWQKAVETVLGDYLQAVCVSDLTPVTETIARLKTGDVTILREHSKDDVVLDTTNTLAEKAAGAPAAIQRILSGVVVADNLGHALGIRESLAEDASVVTPDGIWLGNTTKRSNAMFV